MKNFSSIIIGCAFLIVAIIAAVLGYKIIQGQQLAKDQAQYQQYVQKYRAQQITKPAVSSTPVVSTTPGGTAQESASDLNAQVNAIQDDGGAADFTQMQADVNGL